MALEGAGCRIMPTDYQYMCSEAGQAHNPGRDPGQKADRSGGMLLLTAYA